MNRMNSIGAAIHAGMSTTGLLLLGITGSPIALSLNLAGALTHLAATKWPAKNAGDTAETQIPPMDEHVALADQTPDYDKLLSQLQAPNHVIVAWYAVNGEGASAIVASPDETQRQVLQDVLGSVLQIADNGEVLFSSGPPNAPWAQE